MTAGITNTYNIDISSNAQPLKITLVWTEPPGSVNSSNPVVNNLDLRVAAPDGSTFLGNVFSGGFSTTGGTQDNLNNVETVLVNSPQSGNWVIQVIGTAVNVGNPGQGYALVATADMT